MHRTAGHRCDDYLEATIHRSLGPTEGQPQLRQSDSSQMLAVEDARDLRNTLFPRQSHFPLEEATQIDPLCSRIEGQETFLGLIPAVAFIVDTGSTVPGAISFKNSHDPAGSASHVAP